MGSQTRTRAINLPRQTAFTYIKVLKLALFLPHHAKTQGKTKPWHQTLRMGQTIAQFTKYSEQKTLMTVM
ncbi:hypothetical protein [Yoonia sp.]|uniref:hypothetical protein n=1 Tax=Yoonia sp. TaxID=2212373 RepID=UPI00358DF814